MMRADLGIASLASEVQNAAPAGMKDRLMALLRGVTRPQARSLRCVETLQLGPKRALYLVECDGQRFLAGAGNEGVNTLVPLSSNGFRNATSISSAAGGDAA